MIGLIKKFKEKHSKKIHTAAKSDSIFRDLLIVPDGSEEWHIMWGKLARHRLNRGLNDPCSSEYYDEVWQYMNSEKHKFRYIHRFRHKPHPKTKRPEYINIKASYLLEFVANE